MTGVATAAVAGAAHATRLPVKAHVRRDNARLRVAVAARVAWVATRSPRPVHTWVDLPVVASPRVAVKVNLTPCVPASI